MANKYYGYRKFQIDEHLSVECQMQDTNYGFRHLATLLQDGKEISHSKACYYNRTWEAWTYQSVIKDAISKSSLSKKEKEAAYNWANGDHTDWSRFNQTGAIAMLGNLFGETDKEKNDWKARMLKAGLGEGFSMPDDWNELSEEDKQSRLDMVINELTKVGK